MNILAYFDRFISCIKVALQDYDNCEGYSDKDIHNDISQEYDEEVELIWLAYQALY